MTRYSLTQLYLFLTESTRGIYILVQNSYFLPHSPIRKLDFSFSTIPNKFTRHAPLPTFLPKFSLTFNFPIIFYVSSFFFYVPLFNFPLYIFYLPNNIDQYPPPPQTRGCFLYKQYIQYSTSLVNSDMKGQIFRRICFLWQKCRSKRKMAC
jgi:hypothetical protein